MNKCLALLLLMLTLYLGQHQGYLALFEKDSDIPSQIFPYKISQYPPNDQRILNEGTVITSPLQLAKLLEDYLS